MLSRFCRNMFLLLREAYSKTQGPSVKMLEIKYQVVSPSSPLTSSKKGKNTEGRKRRRNPNNWWTVINSTLLATFQELKVSQVLGWGEWDGKIHSTSIFLFWLSRRVCGILISIPPALEGQNLNHWTTREVPHWVYEQGIHLFIQLLTSISKYLGCFQGGGRWSSIMDSVSPTAACENPGQIKECPPALRCLWVREQTLENSDPACFHSNWASGPSSRWPMTTPTLGGRALQHSGHIQCQALQSVGQEWPFHLAVFLSFLGPGVGSLGRCKKKQRQAVHYNSGPRPASSITRHRIRLISEEPWTCSSAPKGCFLILIQNPRVRHNPSRQLLRSSV